MTEKLQELKNLIKEQYNQTKSKMFEFSFSRIKQHIDQSDTVGFAILTSWRQPPKDLTDPEQIKAWKQQQKSNLEALKGHVREKGLGFVQLRGHWKECVDDSVPYDQCPEDKLTDAIEPVLMVPKIDFETAKNIGQAYNQDAILYSGPETGGVVSLVFRDGSTVSLGKFSPMTLGQAYTEFRTKSSNKQTTNRVPRYFKFEGLTCPANSFMESLADQAFSETLKTLSEGLSVETNEQLKDKLNR